MRRPFFVIAAGFVLGEVFALQMKMAGIEEIFLTTGRTPLITAAFLVTGALGAGVFPATFFAVHFLKIPTGRAIKRFLPFYVVLLSGLAGAGLAGSRLQSLEKQEYWVQVREGRIAAEGRLERIEETGDGLEIWIREIRERKAETGPETQPGTRKKSEEGTEPWMESEEETESGPGAGGDCRKERVPDRLIARIPETDAPASRELSIGMKVEVNGYLSPFKPPENPGEFDYRTYSLSKGIGGQIGGAKIKVLNQDYIPFHDFLRKLRGQWSRLLGKLCGEEEAGLFRSAILGEKKNLDGEIRRLYQQSGIAHLLAISGLHLSILGMGVYKGLRRAGISTGFGAITAGILVISYGVLTGASQSTNRAVFMMLIAFLGDVFRRTYDPLTALGLAAVLITCQEPYQLVQSGFQLSFGAVFGICLFNEARRKAPEKEKIRILGGISKGLGASLAVQAATLPVVAFHFFRVPVYGIFLNLIVIPLMAYVLYSGIAGIGFGSLSPTAGAILLWPGRWIFKLYQRLSAWTVSLPGNSLLLGRPELWQTGLYYGLLIFGVYLIKKKGRNPFAVLTLTLFLGTFLLKTPEPGGLSVTFLDVGQGDGIVLQKGKTVILIDGGSTDKKALGSQILTPFLESRGIGEISCAMVSHGDEDHINGLRELLEEGEIPVKHLILPAHGKGQEVYEELSKLAEERGSQVSYMSRGDQLAAGKKTGFILTCLYPGEPGEGQRQIEDRNSHSLVLLAEYRGFSMVLTGDLDCSGENAMLAERSPEEAQVLKAGHHGAKNSTGQELLDRLKPRDVIISCGEDNSYGHPHPETIKRLKDLGIRIWITAEQGAIELWTDGERMGIRGFLPV